MTNLQTNIQQIQAEKARKATGVLPPVLLPIQHSRLISRIISK